MSADVLLSAAKKLSAFDFSKSHALCGLDGFVDNIIEVVDKRQDAKNYTRVETIAALGDRISRAAGLSSNLELVVKQQKLGGNGPIMANAMLAPAVKVTYIGCLGRDVIHPVFNDMARRCKAVYSICDPGTTDALEFKDGKLMLGKHQTLTDMNYKNLLGVLPLPKLKKAWGESNLIALTNWTMLQHQTEIWKKLLKDMAGVKVPAGATLFIDLADPEKRPAEEIADACKMLKKFRKTHRVVFGINQKESMEVSRALGLTFKQEEIEQNAVTLRKALDLDVVVIHPTRNAACATEDGSAYFDGPYCQNPKLTTGAGDNFNAGFCLGLIAGLNAQETLAAGVGNSGFYVRNARSAGPGDLPKFLKAWAKRLGDPAF
jgi:sugar/nucleoside kinase (ribokinase family)